MPLNPHLNLAAKLCAALDAGHVTVEQIAVESGYPVGQIEGIANGLPIRTTLKMRFMVQDVLAPIFRAHPELYERVVTPTASRLSTKVRLSRIPRDQKGERGVFEIESESDEWRVFLIRDSHGIKRRIVKIPVDEHTDAEEEKLWRWLDRRDPILKVI